MVKVVGYCFCDRVHIFWMVAAEVREKMGFILYGFSLFLENRGRIDRPHGSVLSYSSWEHIRLRNRDNGRNRTSGSITTRGREMGKPSDSNRRRREVLGVRSEATWCDTNMDAKDDGSARGIETGTRQVTPKEAASTV